MCFEDLYQLHLAAVPDPVSKSTLRRAFKQNWHAVLKYRRLGQHARCTKCSLLSEQRMQATSPEEKFAVAKAHHDHINKIKADRLVATRGAMASEEAARAPRADGWGSTA